MYSSRGSTLLVAATTSACLRTIDFWQSLQRLSLLSIISVSLQYTLGFALALAVWKQVRGGRLLRVLFLIPMMTTPVVMSVIWRTVFHESLGPVNDILSAFGIGPVPWLSSATGAFISVLIVEVWQWTPFMFLLLLAGLVSLPKEPYLAAAIDGAGTWRTFWQVTFPLDGPHYHWRLNYPTYRSIKDYGHGLCAHLRWAWNCN